MKSSLKSWSWKIFFYKLLMLESWLKYGGMFLTSSCEVCPKLITSPTKVKLLNNNRKAKKRSKREEKRREEKRKEKREERQRLLGSLGCRKCCSRITYSELFTASADQSTSHCAENYFLNLPLEIN